MDTENQLSSHARTQEVLSEVSNPCADPEGGTGCPDPPLKNHQNIGFLSSSGPDPLTNHILATCTEPAFNVGSSSAHSETTFKWRFAGGPMMAHLK